MPNILLVSATKLEHHDEELFGIPIHIVGVGKVNAALNTLKLVEKYKPDHIVNFGSCGNLKGYKVGEVLQIGEVYDDFYGCVIPEHEPIKISNTGIKLFTTDTFFDKGAVYSNFYTEKIRKCDIVDMEGYSIAKVGLEKTVSVTIFKWVSDDGSKSSWQDNAAIGYKTFKVIFDEWLKEKTN